MSRKEEWKIKGEGYDETCTPDELEISHNYSFGCFSLNLFIECFDEVPAYAGIRLTREKAIAVRDEIDRILKLDAGRGKEEVRG